MALGLGVLRLPPAHFWSMSMSELNAAVEGHTGAAWAAAPISQHEFGALMGRYPDQSIEQET